MILARQNLPELSHIVPGEIASSGSEAYPPLFVTVGGRQGAVFELPLVDLEASDCLQTVASLKALIESLADGHLVRFIHRAEMSHEISDQGFRAQALSTTGFVRRQLLLSIEGELSARQHLNSTIIALFKKTAAKRKNDQERAFLNSVPLSPLIQLGARALTSDELIAEFELPQAEVSRKESSIDFGDSVCGVVRIHKPGVWAINEGTLAAFLDQFPLPFEISVSAKKISKHRTDFRLRSQLAKSELMQDSLTQSKAASTEKALRDTLEQGTTFCEVEWLVTLRRLDERTLRQDLDKVRSLLSQFGETMIETVGCEASYVASRIGSRPHFTFLEETNALRSYLPAFGYGEAGPAKLNTSERVLLAHRLDGSVHAFDQFNSKYLAYNTIISGKSGSGKSVLANAISSALLNDPNIQMIKIDVGGSYKKECELLNGTEIDFSLDSPSGINPFGFFAGDMHLSNEAIDVVAEFLSNLVREEGETQISKVMRSAIERSLKSYLSTLGSGDSSPSLEGFINEAADFPRRELLARWANGGVFENALKESKQVVASGQSRYRYLNFENIQAAASRDFCEGVMAAVIATVNLEMLQLGDRSKGQVGKRLVLFCDETKFFIDSFHHFFLLTAANFRKYGHGLILIFQNIKDAEIKLPDGSTDLGLILNSPTRFFLQADTDPEYLASQFQLSDRHLDALVANPYRGKEFRETVLQDDTGTRLLRLYLTDEEYWRMTSTREDVDKYNGLRKMVPHLTVEEAIRCLAIGYGR